MGEEVGNRDERRRKRGVDSYFLSGAHLGTRRHFFEGDISVNL